MLCQMFSNIDLKFKLVNVFQLLFCYFKNDLKAIIKMITNKDLHFFNLSKIYLYYFSSKFVGFIIKLTLFKSLSILSLYDFNYFKYYIFPF